MTIRQSTEIIWQFRIQQKIFDVKAVYRRFDDQKEMRNSMKGDNLNYIHIF
ncbi:hypothetical protein BgiMline_029032, partial [Biomphalaria glabrata]